MHLDGAVDHVVQHLRPEVLDHRNFDSGRRRPLLIHLPGGLQRHEPGRGHLGHGIRHPVLDGLLLGQHRAVRVPGDRPLAQHVEGPAGLPQPAHAVVDPARPQPVLGQHEARALLPDQVPDRHPDVGVHDLGVVPEPAVRRVRILHRRHVPHDVDPGRVDRHDDHGRPLVRMDVWIGHRHHDQEVRHGSVGCEPLVPVDHPFVSVSHRRRRQQRRIGSGGVRVRSSRRPTAIRHPTTAAATAPAATRHPSPRYPPRATPRSPNPAHCCRTPPAPAATGPGSRA